MSVTTARSDSPTSVRWHPIVALVLLAIGALNLINIATPWGIGTSPDSVAYIRQARILSEGGSVLGMGTQWPPLYPLILAGTAAISGDPFLGARWLHALLFCVNVALFGVLLLRTTESRWIAVGGVLLLVSARPILTVHAFAWSEPAFLLLVMLSLALLAVHLSGPRRPFWLAAILTGLACLAICGNAAHAGGRNVAAISPRTSLQKPWQRRLFVGVALARRRGSPGAGGRAAPAGRCLPPAHAQLWQAVHHWLAARAGDDAGRRSPVAAVCCSWQVGQSFRRRRTPAPTWRAAFMRLLLLCSILSGLPGALIFFRREHALTTASGAGLRTGLFQMAEPGGWHRRRTGPLAPRRVSWGCSSSCSLRLQLRGSGNSAARAWVTPVLCGCSRLPLKPYAPCPRM